MTLEDGLHLEVFHTPSGGRSRWLTKLSDPRGKRAHEIFHELDRTVTRMEDRPLDGHVMAVLLHAASLGKPLIVHGALSLAGMRNLEELNLAWSRWRPGRYKKIDIVPDRIAGVKPPTEEKAVAAFSGGVDSVFTVLRHARRENAARPAFNYPVRSLLMVHGFDVEPYNSVDFQKLVARVQPFADSLGLDLRLVRTNSRDLGLQDWEDSCGLELAACLHLYAGEFNAGLIGSSNPYDELDLPWGSNPVTDHLMSGDAFSIVHDGAGFSRTDKVRRVMENPVACRILKVCWTSIDQSENCGHCEKCVRTQLNFVAAGAKEPPACFPSPMHIDDIRKIHIESWAQMVEFHSIASFARARNISAPWLTILEERMAAWQPARGAALSPMPRIKRWGRHAAGLVRLGEPATIAWRRGRRFILKLLRQEQASSPVKPGGGG